MTVVKSDDLRSIEEEKTVGGNTTKEGGGRVPRTVSDILALPLSFLEGVKEWKSKQRQKSICTGSHGMYYQQNFAYFTPNYILSFFRFSSSASLFAPPCINDNIINAKKQHQCNVGPLSHPPSPPFDSRF